MITLGIDTASGHCAVSLWRGIGDDGDCLAALSEPMARGHAEALFPMLAELFGKAAINRQAIDRIAVLTGPGTFTGVRLGVAAARGLSLAMDKPTVPVTGFEVVHARLTPKPEQPVAVAFAPKRGLFDLCVLDADRRQIAEPAAVPAEEAQEFCIQARSIAGPGAEQLVAEGWNGAAAPIIVSEGPLDTAATARIGSEKSIVGNIIPLYIRPADAKLPSANTLRAQD